VASNANAFIYTVNTVFLFNYNKTKFAKKGAKIVRLLDAKPAGEFENHANAKGDNARVTAAVPNEAREKRKIAKQNMSSPRSKTIDISKVTPETEENNAADEKVKSSPSSPRKSTLTNSQSKKAKEEEKRKKEEEEKKRLEEERALMKVDKKKDVKKAEKKADKEKEKATKEATKEEKKIKEQVCRCSSLLFSFAHCVIFEFFPQFLFVFVFISTLYFFSFLVLLFSFIWSIFSFCRIARNKRNL
jgi:cation transport ATPase